MKIKKLLTFGLIGLTAATLIGAGISSLDIKPSTTKAVSSEADQVLYLDPTAEISSGFHWKDDSAKFAIYYFDTTSVKAPKWSDFMTASTDLSGCYKTTIDLTGYDSLIYVRLNSASTEPNFNDGNCWGQSINLAISDSLDLFKPTTEVQESGKTKVEGSWYDVVTVEATTNTYYCTIKAEQLDGGAPYAYGFINNAYCIGDTAWPGVAMTNVSGDLYQVSLSESFKKIIFNNQDGNQTHAYQTADLTIQDYMIKVPTGYQVHYDISGVTDGKYVGSWTNAKTPTLTSNYLRIWVNRDNHYVDGYTYSVQCQKINLLDNIDLELLPAGYTDFSVAQDGTFYLAYFDVPTTIVGGSIKFFVYSSTTGELAAATTNDTVYTSGDCAKVYKMSVVDDVLNYTLSPIATTADSISAAGLKKVFEAYYSCSSSKENGFGSFNTFVTTWIKSSLEKDAVWYIADNLSDFTINDFRSLAIEDYATGANKDNVTSLQAKYEMMLANYNATVKTAQPFTFTENGNEMVVTIVIVAALVSITALGIFFILRKKRTN